MCKSFNDNITPVDTDQQQCVIFAVTSYDNIEPDGLRRVGGASQVKHVDSLQQCHFRCVFVEVELQYGVVAKRDQSNPADSRTSSDAVDVQRLDHHAYELRYPLEVDEPNAVRCVQRKHHVGAVRTGYARNT